MYEFKIGDRLSGFIVKNRKEIRDVSAVIYEMEHERCGARLIFLDREDENKTFSVGFKTIPENSTGVFHIIEHSVLCGSRKYPVKEPFVELLKSSLQTFLNAMTFPDKTVYPVSSRNDKDFINLSGVYLDAVFKPLLITNKSVFLQEGWRRELDENGSLRYNGVVFNEMKGAYSSPDELGETYVAEKLYGKSCYGYDSGGCPEEILKLNYESFVAAHAKFYHPSNAYFFLDGSVRLEEILNLIESYIGSFDRLKSDFEIADTWAGEATESEIEYEISTEEDEENKSRLIFSYLTTRFDENLEKLALDIAFDALSASNESPLQKAVLDSGLCEKMNVTVSSSRLRNNLTVEFKNVKDGKAKQLYELFLKTLSDIVDGGICREHLEASMNRFEFTLRERDLGGLPLGIAYNISVFDTWLYGGDPALSLEFSEDFKKLRAHLQDGYFEGIIKKYVLENEKLAKVVMRPSKTLGARRAEEEKQALLREAEKLSSEDIEKIKVESKMLSDWQSTPDSDEALATLPTLEISDIPENSIPTPIEVLSDGSLIRHDMKLSGISYAELFFDASDTAGDELFVLPLLSAMLKSSGTDKLDAFELQNLIKRELGSLTVAPVVFKKNGQARVFLKFGVSFLDTKKNECVEILKKLLYETELSDKAALSNTVRQIKMKLMTGLSSSGNAYGVRRALAHGDSAYALREKLSGFEFYTKIKETEARLDWELDGIIEKIKALRDKIFFKERLTLSVAGEKDERFENSIFAALKTGGERPLPSSEKPLGEMDEGIAIPSRVGFGISAAKLADIGKDVTGSMIVAEMILNFEYLWQEVRVKGGAYGVYMRIGNDSAVSYSSYRDPSPEASLKAFIGAPKFLREFLKEHTELTKYIIGAMGEFEPYLSAPLKASVSTTQYLSGHTEEKHARLRREILATDKAELLSVASVFEELNKNLSSLLVAPKEKISAESILFV